MNGRMKAESGLRREKRNPNISRSLTISSFMVSPVINRRSLVSELYTTGTRMYGTSVFSCFPSFF